MTGHPSHEALWAWAQSSDEALQPVASHVESCPECAAAVADIRVAQELLASLPAVPPMPDALAQRVGVALAEKADRQFLARWRHWWAGLLSPRWLVPVAAGLFAVLVLRGLPEDPAPVAEKSVAQVSQAATEAAPKDVAVPPPHPPPVKRRVTASVAMARKARASDQPVGKAQVLEEGTKVATEAGGSLWMRLADGTRAGLTGATQVTLTRMEEKALRLDVAHGSLAMVVPHREDRLVTVHAGDVEVRDLGTRFLVSRNEGRVLVAVEEGAVEVKTPTTTKKIAAGHAVTWHDGRLDSLTWEVRPPHNSHAAPTTLPPADQRSSAAPLEEKVQAQDEAKANDTDEGDDTAEVSEAPVESDAPTPSPLASSEDEWAKLPPTMGAAPLPPPGRALPARPRSRFDLSGLEERLRELQHALKAPLLPSEQLREAKMRAVTFRAYAGDCPGSLASAERWLRQPSTRRAEEPMWRRSVLTQKWQCLLKLGRVDEARTVQRELDAQP